MLSAKKRTEIFGFKCFQLRIALKNVLAGKYEYLLCKTITLGNGCLVSVNVNCGNLKI